MKPILLVFLFALVSCDTLTENLLKIVSCVFKNEKLITENFSNVLLSIKNGDFSKILSSGFSLFFAIKDEIIKCFYDDDTFL